jgi:hypothetical protein
MDDEQIERRLNDLELEIATVSDWKDTLQLRLLVFIARLLALLVMKD